LQVVSSRQGTYCCRDLPCRGGRATIDWMTKPNAKETVRQLLEELPEDTSLEDIQYHIYVREKIERGLEDVQDGRVLEQDEVERRMAKWLGG
jgi:hypothetical protein